MIGYAKHAGLGFWVALLSLLLLSPAAGGANDWPLQQSARLLPTPPAADIGFGSAVVLDGDTLAVAANGWLDAEADSVGAVYIFSRGPAGWAQQAVLTRSEGDSYDAFGAGLALQGDTLVVAAPQETEEEFGGENGAVYVFGRQDGVWSQRARLTVVHEAVDYPADLFGHSLALDGDTLLIGAYQYDEETNDHRQVVYEFTRDGDDWERGTRLELGPAEMEWEFQRTIALSGDTAMVGMPGNYFDDLAEPGRVYIFRRAAGVWSPAGSFAPADGRPDDLFGCALALEGDTAAAVSCRYDSEDHTGEAYIFVRQGESWAEQAKLNPQLEDDQPLHVATVALDGDTAVLGAPYVHTTAEVSGAAYVYRHDGETWTFQQRLVADNAGEDDRFGWGLDIAGGVIVAGAPAHTYLNFAAQGAVYLFEPQPKRPYTVHLPLVVDPAFFPPGLIVYQDFDAEFNRDIYTIRPDGTGKKNLTQTETWQENSPVWSPDGAQIAYIRADTGNGHRALMVMNADGQGRRVIFDDPLLAGDPAWSPDGRRIAFTGYTGALGPDLYAVDVAGGQLTNLTAHLSGSPSNPAWSPDGTRLAFTYMHLTELYWTVDIAVMDVAGGEATLLTDDPGDEGNVHWSPDGQGILYTDAPGGRPVLAIVPAGGGEPQRVIEGGLHGRWSPDGSHIVFTGWGGGLFRINADGGNLGVVDGSFYATMGDWQP